MVTFWRMCKAMLVFHARWLQHLEVRAFGVHLRACLRASSVLVGAFFGQVVKSFMSRACRSADTSRDVAYCAVAGVSRRVGWESVV